MKDRARSRPHRAKPQTQRQKKQVRATGLARELSDRDSLLDHLDDQPETQEEAWQRARAEAMSLPNQDVLEEGFAENLDHTRDYAGPETATLLDALDAEDEGMGDEVQLPSADASLDVIVLEDENTTQDSGPASEALWQGILTESDPIEQADDQAVTLEEAWQRARAEAIPLPHQEVLEERFGENLDQVRVFAGPETASLLDTLDAEGAARGDEVLLPSASASLDVTAHEVAHVLQGSGPAPEALWPGIVAENDSVEQAAETATQEVTAGETPEQADAETTMKPGWVALFRRGSGDDEIDVTGDDAPADPLTVDVDDPSADPESEVPQRASRTPPRSRRSEGQPPPAQAPPEDQSLATARRAPVEDNETVARTEAVDEPLPELAPGPDRRQEILDIRETSQETWDAARRTTDRHETRDCPGARVRQGERPFQRGPPLDVPDTREVPRAEAAEPEPDIDEVELSRAETRVRNQLARGPPEAERHAGNAEQSAEIRELEREIDLEDAPEIPETPELTLEDATDPQEIDDRRDNLRTTSDTNRRTAITATDEDFGEAALASENDPTLGHDTTLDNLDLPEVSLGERLPDTTLDRVATDANVGQLPLDQVLVAQDRDVETTRERATRAAGHRRTANQRLSDTDDDLEEFCQRACAARETELRNAGTGIGRTREGWRRAIDGKVTERRREGETLAREHRGHVELIHRQSNRRARERLEPARREATARWTEAQNRANNKSQEGRNPSLWERGIAFFREQLNRIKRWIGDFLEACRSAIGALLEAARSAAHAIVEAGHSAITTTIEATRATLDALADNLPGELGEIAQDFRDDAQDFLDQVQTRVDAAADDLNRGIDVAIDDLQTDLDEVFTDFENGINGAIDFVGEALESNPLMVVLRRTFPALAALVESGLNAVSNQAAETLDSWLETAFQATGLDRLTSWLQELEASSPCEETPEEQQERTCTAFNGLMDQAMGWVDSLLGSPAAQSLQAELQEGQEAVAEQQVDQVSDFFGFLQMFAQPIYDAWLVIEDAAGQVMEVLGEVGRSVWRHIAAVLGLDINLDPLTALRRGIERLWDGVVSAVQPLLDGLRAAWRFVREYTPIGAFLDLIAQLPALWQSLTEFAGQISEGIENALARAAQFFNDTVLPVIQGALSAVSNFLNRLLDRWQSFAQYVMGALETLLSIEFGIQILDALRRALVRLATPVLTAIRIVQACAFLFWHAVADAVANLLEWIRTFLDICTGIIAALVAPPLTFVTFFVGAVWLYIIPECFKAPILNFFLDVSLRILRFLPEPANFAAAAIYHGLTAFLEQLRNAPDDQKVQAMDLFASLFAGNAEMGAGVLVGLAAGLWESTGGTIIFLLQAVVWLISLPFKLLQWVNGLMSGETAEAGGGAAREEELEESAPVPAEGEIEDEDPAPLGRSADPPGLMAPEIRDPGAPAREPEETFAGEPVQGRRSLAPLVPEPTESITREDTGATRAQPDGALERADEQYDSLGPSTEEEELDEEETDTDFELAEEEGDYDDEMDDEEAEAEPEAAPITPIVSVPAASRAASPHDTSGRLLRRGGGARAPPSTATPLMEGRAPEELAQAPGELQEGEVGTTPPAAPDLPSVSDFLQQLATNGISREDVRALIDGLRGSVADLVRPLAQRAADELLRFLTAPGTAFRIGVVIGTIAGMLVAEIALAVLTAGGSTAVTAAKGIIMASRGVARLASIVARLRRALAPLFRLIQRLRRTAQGIMGRVMRWLDDVVQWMSRMVRRFLGRRPRQPPRPAIRPRPRPAARPRPSARPRPRQRPRGQRPSGRPRSRPRQPRGRRGPRSRRRGPRSRRRSPRSRRRRPRRRRRRRDRGGIRTRVRLAARAAWNAIGARARTRVIPRSQVLSTARSAARPAAAGISIRVAIRHRGTRMWSLRVSGRRGRRRASTTMGRAWFGRDRRRRPHYSAARDQRARHRRIVRNLTDRMQNTINRIGRDEFNPRDIHREAQGPIRRIEAALRPRPLQGIDVDVQEAHYDRAVRNGRAHLEYHYSIEPNTNGSNIYLGLPAPTYTQGWANHNLSHPFLRDADPRIRSLGPYDLTAPPWNAATHQPYSPPRFRLRPGPRYVGTGGAVSRRRWSACLRRSRFTVERYEWRAAEVQFVRVGSPDPNLVDSRVDHMPKYAADGTNHPEIAPYVRGMLRHDEGRRPRRLRNLTVEEGYGPPGAAHTIRNHVLGLAPGIRTARHMAWRAAFGEVPGHAHAPLLDPTTGAWNPASAFRSLAAANREAQSLYDELAANWITERDRLAIGRQAAMSGRTDGRSVLAYDNNIQGADPPAYLEPVFAAEFPWRPTPWTGSNPLITGDGGNPTLPPLAVRRSSAGARAVMYVKRANQPPNIGWYIHTLFPDVT